MSNNNPTEKQHYVPRKYLRAWCQADGCFFAKRYNERSFKTTPEGVAFKNALYRFTPVTVKMFETMIAHAKNNATLNGHILQLFQKVLLVNAFATMSESLKSKRLLDDNSQQIIAVCRREGLFDKETDDIYRLITIAIGNNLGFPEELDDKLSKFLTEGLEPVMCSVENCFWPILDQARQGALNLPLNDDDDVECFITYICTQLIRTPKFYLLLHREKPMIEPMSTYLLATTIATLVAGMMAHRHEDELTIINNSSELPFITGDQPLLNLLPPSDNPKHFDLFFPISPIKAFFYAEKGRLNQYYPHLKCPDVATVHDMNQRLCNNCTQFIFASTDDILESGGYAVPLRD